MAREIKFRGLPTCKAEDEPDYDIFDRDGNFIVGFYEDGYILGKVVEASDDYISPEFWVTVDRNTVGQYTGLHDKNGREIYENDVVSFGSIWARGDESDPQEESHCGVVEFDSDWGMYKVNCGADSYALGDVITFDGYGVIGNKFENPELLEGKHEQK